MKLFKCGIIGFIILNYIGFGCTKAPSQFAAIPSQSLSSIDRDLFKRAVLHQSKGQIDSAILLWSKFLKKKPNSLSFRFVCPRRRPEKEKKTQKGPRFHV